MRTLTIGRTRSTDIQLEDDSVSRLHARLEIDSEGGLVLVDKGSSNGTFLWHQGSWKRVTRARVEQSSRLRFGAVESSVLDLIGDLAVGLPIVEGTTRSTRDLPGRRKKGVVLMSGRVESRSSFKRPKRNPVTGEIEEGA
jgi:pSer/pThr/pTyr-binding forkhead associated (FHA) protein